MFKVNNKDTKTTPGFGSITAKIKDTFFPNFDKPFLGANMGPPLLNIGQMRIFHTKRAPSHLGLASL